VTAVVSVTIGAVVTLIAGYWVTRRAARAVGLRASLEVRADALSMVMAVTE
jgi:hypothetical protein